MIPHDDFGGNRAFRLVWGGRSTFYSNHTLETHPGFKLWFQEDSAEAEEKFKSLPANDRYNIYVHRREVYITALEYLAQVRGLSKGSRNDAYTRQRTKVEWEFIHAFISHHSQEGLILAGLADELERLRRKAERKIEELGNDQGYARHKVTPMPSAPAYDARQQLLDETQQLVRRLELRVALQKARSPGRPGVTDDQAKLWALRERADELEQGLDLCFGLQ